MSGQNTHEYDSELANMFKSTVKKDLEKLKHNQKLEESHTIFSTNPIQKTDHSSNDTYKRHETISKDQTIPKKLQFTKNEIETKNITNMIINDNKFICNTNVKVVQIGAVYNSESNTEAKNHSFRYSTNKKSQNLGISEVNNFVKLNSLYTFGGTNEKLSVRDTIGKANIYNNSEEKISGNTNNNFNCHIDEIDENDQEYDLNPSQQDFDIKKRNDFVKSNKM